MPSNNRIQIIQKLLRHIAPVVLMMAAFCASGQSDTIRTRVEAPSGFDVDTIVVPGPVEPVVEMDTLSRKEQRRLEQQQKYEQAGNFFNHEVTPARKAAFYSFGFPGLGQIYNRKFWKLPIVYGVVGTGLYFTAANGKQLRRYNAALELRLGDGGDEFEGLLSDSQLTARRNFYRKNTELSAILTAFGYGLNIIDAVVDAHLFEFDISDDLSFKWHPNFLTGNNGPIPGIQLSLAFN